MARALTVESKPAPSRVVEWDEQWRWMQQALAAIPIRQRIVVVLYYMNDLNLQEIADILEIPVGTVKSRLHYGRQALKRRLGLDVDMLAEVLYEFS
jgi:RNA polymerase sigma-70 factor (ECF subfamily)